MNVSLSPAELRKFDENGFVGPFDIYNQRELAREVPRLRAALVERERAAYDLESAGNIANYDRHLDVPFLERHIRHPAIVGRLRSILGNDLLCWRTEFFVKYPGDAGTAWHQSRTLALGSGVSPLMPTEQHAKYPDIFLTLSVWTAITDSTRRNGCLQVMPGTHRELHYDDGKAMHWQPAGTNGISSGTIRRSFFGYDTREMQLDPDWSPREGKALDLEMSAGQCVILWEATMHGSLPNITADTTRMAFVARYVPPQVRVYPDMHQLREFGGVVDLGRWRAVLVCGVDRYRHNRL